MVVSLSLLRLPTFHLPSPSPTSKHTAEGKGKGRFPGDCGRESALLATPQQVADYAMTRNKGEGHHHSQSSKKQQQRGGNGETSHESSHRAYSGAAPSPSRLLPGPPDIIRAHTFAWLAKRVRRDGHQMEHSKQPPRNAQSDPSQALSALRTSVASVAEK